jgi:two-component system sensor histidine kinase BaeS
MRRARLRTRLAGSFVAVALVGVATLAILVIALLPGRLSRLVVERQEEAAGRAARVLERSFERRNGVTDRTLDRAAVIAAEAGGEVTVSTQPSDSRPPSRPTPTSTPVESGEPGRSGDASEAPSRGSTGGSSSGQTPAGGQGDAPGGSLKSVSPSRSGDPSRTPQPSQGPSAGQTRGASVGARGGVAAAASDALGERRTVEVPIVVDGRTVGTVTVAYPSDALPGPERDLETSLRWSILVASAVAIVAALGVALLIARRLDRPISRLIRAARRLGTGDLTARVGSHGAPGEVGELAVTFDQMADALAREDEVRRVLVSDVAHELRTPVTILQASLEELVEGAVEPETDRLSSLHDEVLRLARILQDLESLAAAQAAGLEMNVAPVDLARVTGTAIDRLRTSFATAEVEPYADLEPATVLGDADRLDQVVTNLLTNAVKFTPPGGDVRVRVAALNGDARLEVEDSGSGIPEEELPHVFERFWRGRAGRSKSGSGVGLAVVAELVRAHHGRVEVSNTPGKGASFRVILPRA